MHSVIFVFGPERAGDVDSFLAPFASDTEDTDYLEFEAHATREEAEEQFADWKKQHRKGDNRDYKTVEEWAMGEEGWSPDEDGKYFGHIFNPGGHWDWFEVGGRWDNMLVLRNGKRANVAKVKDVDWFRTSHPESVVTSDGNWDDSPFAGVFAFEKVNPNVEVIRQQKSDEWFQPIVMNESPDTFVWVVDIHE